MLTGKPQMFNVMESAKGLTISEKAFVANCLISSLETKQDDDADNAWKELAEKRCDELLSGKVSGISWIDVVAVIAIATPNPPQLQTSKIT